MHAAPGPGYGCALAMWVSIAVWILAGIVAALLIWA